MSRARWILLALAVLLVLEPSVVYAQANARWSDMYTGDAAAMQRGPGFYLSWIKLAGMWIVFIAWVATADWLNVDCQVHRFNYSLWNPLNIAPFAIAFYAALLIPLYAVGLPLMIVAYLAPVIAYVFYRNARVGSHEKVLTPDHLRFIAAERLRPLGIHIKAERLRADELGPPIKMVATAGATAEDNNARQYTARNSVGFVPAKELMWEAITRRADSMMLDYTAQSMAIRYEVDGVWHNGDSRDREIGDQILVVLKTVAALNPAERRARQMGKFQIQHEKIKYAVTLASQGTPTGERVVTQLDDGSAKFLKLPDLGMRDKLAEQVQELFASKQGFLLLSAPKRGGLTALTNAALGSCDRFTRGFVAVEDVNKPEKVTENIPVTTFDSRKQETAMTVLPRMARLYPDVIVARDLIDGPMVDFLCDQVEQGRLIISSIRAKEAPEALLRVLMLKPSVQKFAAVALGVVNQRLIRKLCETCREPYPPPAQLLQQLRIPAGKVEAFYRPPQAPEKVCPDCGGIGYRGRTAIFEVLVLNDALRDLLAKTPKLEVLRQEARKQGMRGLQEEGILLVAKGVTSLQELMRVLKE